MKELFIWVNIMNKQFRRTILLQMQKVKKKWGIQKQKINILSCWWKWEKEINESNVGDIISYKSERPEG